MAAVVGMTFFGEAASPWLVAGVGLTVVGVVMMKGRRPAAHGSDSDPPRQNQSAESAGDRLLHRAESNESGAARLSR